MTKSQKNCTRIITAILLVASFVTLFWLAPKAQAAVSDLDLNRKALLLGLKTCVTPEYMNREVSVESFNESGINAIFNGKGNNDGSVNVLAGVGNTLRDGDVSCEQVFTGYSGLGGDITGLGLGSSLEDYGYTIEEQSVGSGNSCVSVSYQYGGTSTRGSTNQLCFSVDEKGKVQPKNPTNKNDGSGPINLEFDGSKNFFLVGENGELISYLEVVRFGTPEQLKESLESLVNTATDDCGKNIGRCEKFSLQSTNEDSPLKKQVGVLKDNNGKTPAEIALSKFSGGKYTSFEQAAFTNEDKKALYTRYYNDGIEAQEISIDLNNCMSNRAAAQREYDNVMYTTDGKWCQVNGVSGYTGDFSIISENGQAISTSSDFSSVMHELMRDHIAMAGEVSADGQEKGKEECRKKAQNRLTEIQAEINRTPNASERAALEARRSQVSQMLSNNSYWTTTSNGSIKCSDLPGLAGGTTTGETTYNPGDNVINDDGTIDSPLDDGSPAGTAGTLDGCFGEAGVLGWILCPVLRYVGVAVDGIYTDIETNYLQVKPDIITGVRENGWGTFRNFANIIFAVAFVVVILSQITGVGLSNYNIKKMLPRLIVIVVLVNLSFVLCQAAVDLSNILGYSLNRFFAGLGVNGGAVGVKFGAIDTLLSVINSIGGVAGAGAVVLSIQAGGWMPFLVPLLVVAVTTLIGVFFFFVILGVRQAAIVLLVILSPVAIVCYALPNTQSLARRWSKLFLDMLLVYPICGLLMGGGQYVSRVLLNVDVNSNNSVEVSPMYYFVAVLLPVVSFFFIPSIVRSAVNGMGSIATKLQGMGNRMGAGIGGRIHRSNWAREGMMESARNSAYFRAGMRGRSAERSLNRINNRLSSDNLSDRQRRRLTERQGRAAVRLARSNSIRQKIDKENEESIAASRNGLWEKGNKDYDRMVGNINKEQFEHDINSFAQQNKDSLEFNDQDMDYMAKEHLAALQSVIANPEDYEAKTRVAAIEQNMMKFKSDDGAARITSNYLGVEHGELAKGVQDGVSAGDRVARLGQASKHFQDAYGRDIKDFVGKTDLKSLQAISKGADTINSSSNAGTIKQRKGAQGEDLFYSTDKLSEEVGKFTGRTFEALSDQKVDDIVDAIDRGFIAGKDLQKASEAVQEFYDNPNINKKNRANVDKMRTAIAAHGAVAQSQIGSLNNDNRPSGAMALSSMSGASLQSIAHQISTGDINKETAARIVSNVEAAARDSNVVHSEEWVDAANNIMAAAHARGIGQLNSAGGLSSSVVSDHVDATNVRFNQDYAPVHVDPSLSTASNEDVRAAVESAQAQFKQQAKYHDLNVATEKDVQDALLRARTLNPSATVNSLGFKAGDVVKKVDAGGGTYNYSTVNSALAEEYRTGLKNSAKINFKAGDVIQRGVDNNGIATYNRAADAVAEEYRAALKHNSEIKIQQERRNQKYQPTPPPPTPTP